MYSVSRGWIDTSGRCRTWVVRDPTGAEIAETTTKVGARRVADLAASARPIYGRAPRPAAENLSIVSDAGHCWSCGRQLEQDEEIEQGLCHPCADAPLDILTDFCHAA